MGSVLKGIKEYLIKNKIMRSQAEIEEYEATCHSCKKKFPKEDLRASLPIGMMWGEPLCPKCWKKDRNVKIGILIFVIVLILIGVGLYWFT